MRITMCSTSFIDCVALLASTDSAFFRSGSQTATVSPIFAESLMKSLLFSVDISDNFIMQYLTYLSDIQKNKHNKLLRLLLLPGNAIRVHPYKLPVMPIKVFKAMLVHEAIICGGVRNSGTGGKSFIYHFVNLIFAVGR
ncbi:hypothetical protein D9M68_437100 [compost metagenome]